MRGLKSSITSLVLTTTLASQLFSCGYILHPERQGNKSGKLDLAIVGLDSIGLIFFILPGLIALGVDIYSGTIYMPVNQKTSALDWQKTVKIKVDPHNLNKASIAAAIKEQTGVVVNLDDSRLKVFRDEKLEREVVREG